MALLLPSRKQWAWQDLEVGLFCHFGINTFADLEWSDGTVPASEFNPTDFDAEQWAAAAKLAGMRYLVLTAKHHDGFCNWPTLTTDYSVKSSPFEGDVVGAVAAACRHQGLKLGLYCSPWDRHEPCYPDEAAYDRFYMMQWTELLTHYGEVTEVWFDGAGSQDHQFDWDNIFKVVYHHQPDGVCFNGWDLRWVGNEDGVAPNPCWNVAEDLWGTTRYLPAECDVPLRKGWFWHPDDEDTRKSLPHLWDIYHRSVGHGCNLLLNVAPDRRGCLPEADVAAIVNLHRMVESVYRDDLAVGAEVRASSQAESEPKNGAANAVDGDRRTRWLAADETGWVEVRFGAARDFDRVMLEEWLPEGERIQRWRLLADDDRELASGEGVGHKRIVRFEPTSAESLKLVIEAALAPPTLRSLRVFLGQDPD